MPRPGLSAALGLVLAGSGALSCVASRPGSSRFPVFTVPGGAQSALPKAAVYQFQRLDTLPVAWTAALPAGSRAIALVPSSGGEAWVRLLQHGTTDGSVIVRAADGGLLQAIDYEGLGRWRVGDGPAYWLVVTEGGVARVDAGAASVRWQISAPGVSSAPRDLRETVGKRWILLHGEWVGDVLIEAATGRLMPTPGGHRILVTLHDELGLFRIGASDDVDSLDPATGSVRWRVPPFGFAQTAPQPTPEVIIVSGAGKQVPFTAGLHPRTGALLWGQRYPQGYLPNYVTDLAGGVLLLVSGNAVARVDPRTGAPVWWAQVAQTFDSGANTIFSAASGVVLALRGNLAYGFDARSGQARWSTQLWHRVIHLHAERSGRILIETVPLGTSFTESDKTEHCQLVELEVATGAVRGAWQWPRQRAQPTARCVVVSDGVILALDGDRVVGYRDPRGPGGVVTGAATGAPANLVVSDRARTVAAAAAACATPATADCAAALHEVLQTDAKADRLPGIARPDATLDVMTEGCVRLLALQLDDAPALAQALSSPEPELELALAPGTNPLTALCLGGISAAVAELGPMVAPQRALAILRMLRRQALSLRPGEIYSLGHAYLANRPRALQALQGLTPSGSAPQLRAEAALALAIIRGNKLTPRVAGRAKP